MSEEGILRLTEVADNVKHMMNKHLRRAKLDLGDIVQVYCMIDLNP